MLNNNSKKIDRDVYSVTPILISLDIKVDRSSYKNDRLKIVLYSRYFIFKV